MDVLVLNAEEVTRLLPMPECIKVMRDALAALARGEALVPLRTIMRVPAVGGFLGLMPGALEAQGFASGSAIKQTFTANAGDPLAFDVNYLTNAPLAATGRCTRRCT